MPQAHINWKNMWAQYQGKGTQAYRKLEQSCNIQNFRQVVHHMVYQMF